MHIARVTIENIRCFEKVTFDFSETVGSSRFAILLGDNGVGKTTLLRCIALGLCDKSDAAGLLSELWGDFIRDPKKPARIDLTLISGRTTYSLTKTIKVSEGRSYEVSQKEGSDFPWRKLFVCGYGAQRGTYGTKDYSEYASVDAIYSLFNYETMLQNAELMIRRRVKFNRSSAKQVCRWLDRILLLPNGSVQLKDQGIFIRGRGGSVRPIMATGDGYQSTVTWVLDFLGWALLAGKEKLGNRISGIVLVDELEQHLHPEWQRHIVRLLREQFPHLQFITTTHSPLCAGGVADLTDEVAYLGLLRMHDNEVSSVELAPPHGARYDQILTSEAFGLPIARSEATEKMINTLRAASPGTVAHKHAMDMLRQFSISAAEDEADRQLRKRIAENLTRMEAMMAAKKG